MVEFKRCPHRKGEECTYKQPLDIHAQYAMLDELKEKHMLHNKKIKDLTTDDIDQICTEHHKQFKCTDMPSCYGCPLAMKLAGANLLDVFICTGRLVNKLRSEVTLDD